MKVMRAVITSSIVVVVLLSAAAWGADVSAQSTVSKPAVSVPAIAPVITEFKLPFPEGRVFRPRIAGDWVVGIYNTDMKNTTATAQILAYNLSTKQLQTLWPSGSGWPDANGNFATWTGKLSGVDTYTFKGAKNATMPSNLVIYDLTTGRYYCSGLRTGSAMYPVAEGNYVAYVGNGEIILVDMAASVQWLLSDRSLGSKNYNPAIGGDYVTWLDDNEKDHPRFRVYRISTRETFTIDSEPGVTYRGADTDGKTIVWTAFMGSDSVYAYDIPTRQTTKMTQGYFPDIDNGLVVYMKAVKGGPAVYGKCLPSGQEFRISKGFADQGPSISGNRVIWCKDNVIYCAELDFGNKKPIAKPLSPSP